LFIPKLSGAKFCACVSFKQKKNKMGNNKKKVKTLLFFTFLKLVE